MTLYVVVNLDGSAEELENRLLYTLLSLGKRKRNDGVVVVGAVSEDVDNVSIALERTIKVMNNMASNGIVFKRFVLLDKNNKGKAIGGGTDPPEDVNGKLVFLTHRPSVHSLINNKNSWWGQVRKLRGQKKLRRRFIR